MGTPEGEEETPLTLGILFSLDRCLLMGDPKFLYYLRISKEKIKRMWEAL
jgi:hypothetical protein